MLLQNQHDDVAAQADFDAASEKKVTVKLSVASTQKHMQYVTAGRCS